jgi:hypothetical protein
LALTASYPPEKFVTFPSNPPYDENQLRMEIVYLKNESFWVDEY